MAPRRRSASSDFRTGRVPASSRVTVRRTQAPFARTATLAAALRDGRAALHRIEGELEALLATLREPGAQPGVDAADRLRGALESARAVVGRLGSR
jgi:hypothetical protein